MQSLSKTQKAVRIGLIGVGKMGQNHLRILSMLKDVEIAFIYDISTQIAQEVSKKYNVPFKILNENILKGLDGIIIVSPTSTHSEYFFKVAPFVKNIFVEKPLAHNVECTKRIVEYTKSNKINLQVGFIERYNPAIAVLKSAIKNSNEVINMDFSRTNRISSRITDVDVVLDLMIHDIDLSLYLNGAVKNVYAYGVCRGDIIEFARAIITHKNGRFTELEASRITEKRIRQISVTCDNMYVDCNLLSKEVFVSKQSLEQYLNDVSIVSKTETINVPPMEALLLELMDFVALCKGECVEVAGSNAALEAMEIVAEVQKQIKGA